MKLEGVLITWLWIEWNSINSDAAMRFGSTRLLSCNAVGDRQCALRGYR